MPESVPGDPITKSQAQAARSLIVLLKRAVEASASSSVREGEQIVFLSGPRGSGKSQILDMFYEVFHPAGSRNVSSGSSETRERLRNEIGQLAQNSNRPIFWLEPINFDQLTSGANLTAALLARLGESGSNSAQENLRYASRLDYVSEIDRARNELTSLQSKILLALEGNALERKPYVDQDTYAIHAMESERARPTIRIKLTNILTRLLPSSRGVFADNMHGLYVVVIDDVDVRPMRAIMALQLAEFLAIPRLFFVFAGDFDTVDQTLFYQTQSEFLQMLGSAGSDPLVRHDIENRANYIASSLLRKLVPPERRISIEPMSASEGWEMTWQKDSSVKLITGECDELRKLLEPNQEDGTEWTHLGSEQVLHAPYRYVKDMFETLSKALRPTDEPGESTKKRLCANIWQQFTTIVDEDAQLGLLRQRALKAKAKWSPLYLDVSDITSHIVVGETHQAIIQRGEILCVVNLSTCIRRDLHMTLDHVSDPFSGSTSAIFMLAHDYHVACGKSVRGSARWHATSRSLLASHTVKEGEIAWYRMTWPTYRQEQRFMHAWNEVLHQRKMEARNAEWVTNLAIDFCSLILRVGGESADTTTTLEVLRTKQEELAGMPRTGLQTEILLQLAWMLDPERGVLGANLSDAKATARLDVDAGEFVKPMNQRVRSKVEGGNDGHVT